MNASGARGSLVGSRLGAAFSQAMLASLVLTAAAAGAPLALDERFNDGGFDAAGADPDDAVWHRRSAFNPDTNTGTTLSIINDNGPGGIGSGNALRVTTGSATVGNPHSTVYGIFPALGGSGQGVALGAGVGSFIQYDFDFRVATLPASTTTIWRFGLYQSGGTAIAGDGGIQSFDDPGYFVSFRVGAFAPLTSFGRDNSIGDAPLYPPTTQFTSLFISTSGPTAGLISSTSAHHVSLLLERAVGGVQITLWLNGNELFSVLDTSPITSFDYVAFAIDRDGAGVNHDFILDNLTIAIPEPASALLVAVGLMATVRPTRRFLSA